MTEEDLSQEEMEELQRYLTNIPKAEEKHGVFTFFSRVFKAKDTSKGANVESDELNSVRILQSTANYASLMNLPNVEDFLRKEGEIILATSLSKEGFFIKQIVTQKREMTARTVTQHKKRNWLGKKEETTEYA